MAAESPVYAAVACRSFGGDVVEQGAKRLATFAAPLVTLKGVTRAAPCWAGWSHYATATLVRPLD